MRTLAVVVLNWNGARGHARAAAHAGALPRARGLARCDVLVVDNGSSDGSAAAIGARVPRRRGAGAAREPALRRAATTPGSSARSRAGADAVMLLNNDTEAEPGLLERLLLALEQDPRAGAAAPLIYFAAPRRRDLVRGRPLRRRRSGSRRTAGCGSATAGSTARSSRPATSPAAACSRTREAWERVGLLDERYFIYAEDADWCLRARAAGFRLLFVPTARLWHKVSASSGGARARGRSTSACART